MMKTFTAIIPKEGNDYVATSPEVGTVSQGHTVAEAIANLQEATEPYRTEFPDAAHGAMLRTFEVHVS